VPVRWVVTSLGRPDLGIFRVPFGGLALCQRWVSDPLDRAMMLLPLCGMTASASVARDQPAAQASSAFPGVRVRVQWCGPRMGHRDARHIYLRKPVSRNALADTALRRVILVSLV